MALQRCSVLGTQCKASQRNFLTSDWVLAEADDRERIRLRGGQGWGIWWQTDRWQGLSCQLHPRLHLLRPTEGAGWAFMLPCPSVPCSRGRVTPHQPPIHPLWEGRVCVGHCTSNCSPSWGQCCVGGGGIKAGRKRLLCPPRPWFSPRLHGEAGLPCPGDFY